MAKLRKNWVTLAVSACVFAFLGYLIIFEGSFTESGIVKALSPEAQQGLYETAVSGLLNQSTSFSTWSIGLIVAGWVAVVNTDHPPSQPVMAVFVLICGAALVSVFLGQLLHQIVINDIRLAQDPLDNSLSWSVIMYQFLSTVTAAVLVAGSIIWRRINV